MVSNSNKKCTNCGNIGHVNRNCIFPIKSLGLIVFRKTANDTYVCMVQRNHSLSFWEFICGKYLLSNKEYIKKLFSKMTQYERYLLQSCSFEELCEELFKRPVRNNEKTNEWLHRQKQFTILKYGYYIKNTFQYMFINIDTLIETTESQIPECELEFPKGRPKYDEISYDTAIREFEEETKIPENSITVYTKYQIKQNFYGTNGNKYNNYYFIGELVNNDISLSYDINTVEVNQVKWIPINDVFNLVKNSHQNKYTIFKKAYNVFLSLQTRRDCNLSL